MKISIDIERCWREDQAKIFKRAIRAHDRREYYRSKRIEEEERKFVIPAVGYVESRISSPILWKPEPKRKKSKIISILKSLLP